MGRPNLRPARVRRRMIARTHAASAQARMSWAAARRLSLIRLWQGVGPWSTPLGVALVRRLGGLGAPRSHFWFGMVPHEGLRRGSP